MCLEVTTKGKMGRKTEIDFSSILDNNDLDCLDNNVSANANYDFEDDISLVDESFLSKKMN